MASIEYTNVNSDSAGFRDLSSFQGYLDERYNDPHVSGYSFVFVTKPMLFILPTKPADSTSSKDALAYGNMKKDPKFAQFIAKESGGNAEDGVIAKMLSYKQYPELRSAFLPIFTNRAISFDAQDVTLDTEDAFQTKEGYRIPLPGTKTQSEAAGTVNIQMLPDNANLNTIKMITLWVNYIANVTNGVFDANPDMVRSCQLDYVSSIFYFNLDPDGRTIRYWSKHTGCFPTSIPYSALSFSRGDNSLQNVNVTMAYTLKEDMTPRILEDFNKVSLRVYDCWDDSEVAASDESGNDDYVAGSTSPLLSERSLEQNASLLSEIKSPSRDPIVFRAPESKDSSNPDPLAAHYELSFGQDTLSRGVLKSVTGESGDGLIDYASFWKSPFEG